MKTFVLLIILTGIATGAFTQIIGKKTAIADDMIDQGEIVPFQPVQFIRTAAADNNQKKCFRLLMVNGQLPARDQRKDFFTGTKNRALIKSGVGYTRFWLIARGISYILHSLNGKGGLRFCCQKTALTFSPRTLKKVTGLTFSIPIGQ